MINARRFSHVTLETPDIERQIAYFTEVNGLNVAERHDGRAYLATKHGDLVVTLESGSQARCAKLAFQVARDTEFDDIRKGVEAEGLSCQARNDAIPGIPQMLSFEDPKGTVCEVFAAQTPISQPKPVPASARSSSDISLSSCQSRNNLPTSTAECSAFVCPTGFRTGSCSCAAVRIITPSILSKASGLRCTTLLLS